MGKRLTVSETFSGFLNKARQQRENLMGRPRLKVTVHNSVLHFKFVEYGTDKMEARAMVRKSMPEIEDFLRRQLSRLGPFFTDEELDEGCRLTAQYALDVIRSRTPIETGELVRGFEVHVTRE